MQFNSNLIQSFLGQSKGAKANPLDDSNVLATPKNGGSSEVSNEFLSLLNETKALAKSGVSPEEFIETLNSDDLGLSKGEKKALAKSFISALEGKSEEIAEESGDMTKEGLSEESDLSKIINNKKNSNTSNIKNNESVAKFSNKGLQSDKIVSQSEIDADSNIKNFKSSTEELEVVNPKISNGKLLTLKENSAKKMGVGSFQSSEDFVAQSKVAAAKSEEAVEGSESKSFVPKSNNKVLAFNREQNTINNNIFAGKNPFVSGNELKVSKLNNKTETSSLENNILGENSESIAPLIVQNNQNSNGNQTSFGSNSNVKVLDFSNINTTNTEQLIDKISNYITTSRLEKQDNVELIVKHHSLGQIKVVASKGQLPDQINLEIVANSDKGHQFFKSNEVEMIKSLSNSGVKLNDVKISMGRDFNMQSSDKGDSQFNQGQGSQNSKYGGQQASSNQDQSRRDRREQMWNTYRERLGA